MSKSTAWGLASVSPGARRLAEQAASRAGVTLEEWLDRAIAELSEDAPSAKTERHRVRPEGASARDLQERLRASAGTVERRDRSANDMTSKARELSPASVAPPPNNPTGGGRSANSIDDTEKAVAAPEGEPDPQMEAEGLRSGRTSFPFAQAQNFPRETVAPHGFDLEFAVSKIASRRRALDAQQAHDGLEPRLRNPADSKVEDEAVTRLPKMNQKSTLEISNAPADPLRLGLHVLSDKLDALRREWSGGRASARDLAALRDQMTEVRRSLSDLAPREIVAALTDLWRTWPSGSLDSLKRNGMSPS